ncbi:MAG: hypothetical protein HUU37_01285 [Bdellovibrionales bacterium]|nr:hypothetical protein [Bdellovibrionales bacterium]
MKASWRALLAETRKRMGYHTSRAFFDHLKKQGVSFNYSYYMRIEREGALPSAKVMREIASALPEKAGEALVLGYCREQFPEHGFLFPERAFSVEAEPPPAGAPADGQTKQKELSLRQVATIVKSENHYYTFLLLSLARTPIRLAEIQEHFPARLVPPVLEDLLRERIILERGGSYSAVSVETRFPEAYNEELKRAYARMDEWDVDFGKRFQLEPFVNKMMIRRVSPRYLGIIRHQLEGLFDLVRSSDENDARFNESVIQLRVNLRKGRLPG